jgi:hypothetical protein
MHTLPDLIHGEAKDGVVLLDAVQGGGSSVKAGGDSMTPTARTLDALRKSGYCADVVERFVKPKEGDGFKRDLFGCIDLVAVRRGEPGVLAIQATTAEHMAHRLAKARRRWELSAWLSAGNRFEVWGWYQLAGGRWQVRRAAILPGESEATISLPPRRGRRPVQRGLFDGPTQVAG